MEQAITKLLDGMPAVESNCFQQLQRPLALVPGPEAKQISAMTHHTSHAEADELKRFTPSELVAALCSTSMQWNTAIKQVHTSAY